MTAPSPVIAETLAAHQRRVDGPPWACWCGLWPDGERHNLTYPEHVAQALADAGVLDPEQVREREAAVLHALADKWQWGAWADVLTHAGEGLMAKPQAVTDWLRAQAVEAAVPPADDTDDIEGAPA